MQFTYMVEVLLFFKCVPENRSARISIVIPLFPHTQATIMDLICKTSYYMLSILADMLDHERVFIVILRYSI